MSSTIKEFTQENSKTDVSVSFRRPYLIVPPKGHQQGVSLQSFLHLGKTHRPDSWRGFCYIYLPFYFSVSGLSVLTGLHFHF